MPVPHRGGCACVCVREGYLDATLPVQHRQRHLPRPRPSIVMPPSLSSTAWAKVRVRKKVRPPQHPSRVAQWGRQSCRHDNRAAQWGRGHFICSTFKLAHPATQKACLLRSSTADSREMASREREPRHRVNRESRGRSQSPKQTACSLVGPVECRVCRSDQNAVRCLEHALPTMHGLPVLDQGSKGGEFA